MDFMDVLLKLPEMEELELLLMLIGPPAFTERERGREREGERGRERERERERERVGLLLGL